MSDMTNDIIDKFIETDESYVLTKEEMNYLKKDEQAVMDYYLKIVTNGNCCICGKPLDSGLFLCKECARRSKND